MAFTGNSGKHHHKSSKTVNNGVSLFVCSYSLSSWCFSMCLFLAEVYGFLLCVHWCFERCGFAQSQEAYDQAVNEIFTTLDEIEDHLGSNRYLCGERLTLADICLFTTLIRFDPVYNILFKCTKKKLVEYTNLYGYLRDIYQVIIKSLLVSFPLWYSKFCVSYSMVVVVVVNSFLVLRLLVIYLL